ncbi:MAG: hypothetical protein EB830_03520 [Nitrosopumilus sp. H13]|nr:MAG: hypothetical protein EB830_03520 [Nitrosopumilus sp. H13]
MIRGLRGMIAGGVSTRDFGAATGLGDSDSQELLDALKKEGIGVLRGSFYHFEDGDRLRVAVELLKEGHPIDEISEALHWRDFEGLTAEILSSMGFAVMRNLVLTKPRMEIDVVGVRLGIAMLVDCKHWGRTSTSAMRTAVTKQVERTRHYVAKTPGSAAVPVMVALHRGDIDFVGRVPIVPISGFASFVDEFYGNLDRMQTIRRD